MIIKQKNSNDIHRVNKLGVSLCFGAILSVLAVGFSAPASAQSASGLEQAINGIGNGSVEDASTPEKDLRARAMREAAQSYGARSGLLFRTKQIRVDIDRAAKSNDVIYNFGPLMLVDQLPDEAGVMRSRDVLPPVIVKEDVSFKQDSDTIIQKGGTNYHIFSQAKFLPIPPTWRSYLYRNVGEQTVAKPPSSLLPRSPGEQARYQQWISEGWSAGISQADSIYDSDMNRLDRDFNGMVLYYELVAQNMVTLPYIATSNSGVSGDATHLNLNNVTLRITIMPEFRHDSSKWTPVAR